MSYILDALRKSDQQRQRGSAPTLQTVQAKQTFKRPVPMAYGVLGVMLVGTGIAIGWLHPWQPEQRTAEPGATRPLESDARRITPLPTNSVLTQSAPASLPANPQTRRTSRITNAATSKEAPMASAGSAADAAVPPGNAQEQKVLNLSELPPAIQQEIPPMSISVHAYSTRPGDRMVGINDRMLREGGTVPPGLTLEQITPEGMVFSYKGLRFKRGIGTAESR